MTRLLSLGVVGKSLKKNEKRVAIHPSHLPDLPERIRKQITFEKGYGQPFGIDDKILAQQTSGLVASHAEIMENFDCVLLPKPVPADLEQLKTGAVLWGWPHCVEQKAVAQLGIDKKLTLIAWENMFRWGKSGEKNMHVFYKNNELAGYAGVNHALSLMGITANYGPSFKAAVLSFGSVSRGAIYALLGQGFSDITVYTNRPVPQVRDQLPGIDYQQMKQNGSGKMYVIAPNGDIRPLGHALSDKQIIVNGTLQDTDHPKMFVPANDADNLLPGTMIIDISCDEGMGFWCSRPTSFEEPILETDNIFYYAVDHTPAYYWRSASWEISTALLPYLPTILNGPQAWEKNPTIKKAIDIRNGNIQNQKILSFQNRAQDYPHSFL